MYYAEYQGVYFVEGCPAEAVAIGPISTELNGLFSQNQLKSLDDIKARMCTAVREKGGNCVVDFKYGQRSTFWKSLFGMDNVLWHSSGIIARIDPKALEKYRRPN
jgi:hypothetical protein